MLFSSELLSLDAELCDAALLGVKDFFKKSKNGYRVWDL